MRIYIKVNAKLRDEMAGIYGLSRMGIWKALNGLTNSDKSIRVRQYAMSNGGQMVQEDYFPSCKTVYGGDGSFTQQFDGGVVVKMDPQERAMTISRNGEELERFQDVTLNTWANVLRMAQAYADGNEDKIAN